MRQIKIMMMVAMITTAKGTSAQKIDFLKVKSFEHLLEDVMEITDTNLIVSKLQLLEEECTIYPSEINKARLGIIYHETALNLSFFSNTTYKGYAKRSYDLLTEVFNLEGVTSELLPIVGSYRASALALVGAETKNLKLVGESFALFSEAVNNYGEVSYLPEFLRGSVAENLPWIFYKKKKFAKLDFQSILNKQLVNPNFADWKIMSFTYLALAKQQKAKKYKQQTLIYLDKAIQLDPNNKAGRKKAEELKSTLTK